MADFLELIEEVVVVVVLDVGPTGLVQLLHRHRPQRALWFRVRRSFLRYAQLAIRTPLNIISVKSTHFLLTHFSMMQLKKICKDSDSLNIKVRKELIISQTTKYYQTDFTHGSFTISSAPSTYPHSTQR